MGVFLDKSIKDVVDGLNVRYFLALFYFGNYKRRI